MLYDQVREDGELAVEYLVYYYCIGRERYCYCCIDVELLFTEHIPYTAKILYPAALQPKA